MKNLYLALAIVGAVIPYVFFVQHFSTSGFGLTEFVRALFANPAAGGFAADLLLTSTIFWIFMFQQRSRKKGPAPWSFVALNLFVGLSCAFPAYLYVRERQRDVA